MAAAGAGGGPAAGAALPALAPLRLEPGQSIALPGDCLSSDACRRAGIYPQARFRCSNAVLVSDHRGGPPRIVRVRRRLEHREPSPIERACVPEEQESILMHAFTGEEPLLVYDLCSPFPCDCLRASATPAAAGLAQPCSFRPRRGFLPTPEELHEFLADSAIDGEVDLDEHLQGRAAREHVTLTLGMLRLRTLFFSQPRAIQGWQPSRWQRAIENEEEMEELFGACPTAGEGAPFTEEEYEQLREFASAAPGDQLEMLGGEVAPPLSLPYDYNVQIESCDALRPHFQRFVAPAATLDRQLLAGVTVGVNPPGRRFGAFSFARPGP
jgi:hypothetical protein